jgi:hypothetical protein
VNDTSTDDGFETIRSRSGRAALTGAVHFGPGHAHVPGDVAAGRPERVTWAWDGNGTLRARFSDDGDLRLYQIGGSRARACAVGAVYRVVGRPLRGRYPITRVDGNDVYVDVSGEGGR